MKTHDFQQGSPEWHAHRATHFNASDAPAMMGCSPYMNRTELMTRLKTGISAEVDTATQRRFDDGHRFEALARPLAEAIVGEDLYPVTGSAGNLSASFDGLTLMEDTAFEHKTLNDGLRYTPWDEGNGDHLPLLYRVQMEQQLMVSGAERVLFMASAWNGDTLLEERHCWYSSDSALRAQIAAGWKLFAEELPTFEPAAVVEKAVARPVETLPAVSIRMEGQLAVRTNLPAFGTALRDFIGRMVEKPSTDQEFADAEAECKALKRAEEALDAGETNALAELADVDAFRRMKADLHALARSTRLAREKLVSAEKENRKGAIVAGAIAAFRDHITALNTRLGKPYMPTVPADFGGAVKGMKSLSSMEDKVSTELARAKIAANEVADRIDANLKHLTEKASAHKFLFADAATIVLKAADDLQALVSSRIGEHDRAEAARLEAQREQIRAEEAAKLQREADAQRQQAAQVEAERIRREQVEKLQAERIHAEEVARVAAEAQAGIDAARKAEELPPILLDELTKTVELIATESATSLAINTAKTSAGEKPTLKLGEINARLGYTVSAEFLAELGYVAHTERSSKLYRESLFPAICDAIRAHTTGVREQYAYRAVA